MYFESFRFYFYYSMIVMEVGYLIFMEEKLKGRSAFFNSFAFSRANALCAGTMVSWEIHRKALRRIDGIPIFVLHFALLCARWVGLGMCK